MLEFAASTLSPRYIQKIVVMHACLRSVANEQHREKRLVIITRGRFAIGLNPLRVLCAERIMLYFAQIASWSKSGSFFFQTFKVSTMTPGQA